MLASNSLPKGSTNLVTALSGLEMDLHGKVVSKAGIKFSLLARGTNNGDA